MNEGMEYRGFIFLLCFVVANLQAAVGFHVISSKLARLQSGAF